jgi:hypothetical protein
MSATIYVHKLSAPTVSKFSGYDTLNFRVSGGSDLALFLPPGVAEAMMAAFNASSVPGYDALLGFVEEVRDHRPEVISGRHNGNRDPQDDQDDLMPLDEFEAFQSDAEKLVGKKQKVAA